MILSIILNGARNPDMVRSVVQSRDRKQVWRKTFSNNLLPWGLVSNLSDSLTAVLDMILLMLPRSENFSQAVARATK